MKHLELINKVMLLTGSLVGYAYVMEFFIAYYSGNEFERYVFLNRLFGPMWWGEFMMLLCNCVIPQIFWFKWARTNIAIMFVVSITTNIGMWFERFVIIVVALHRDFLPSSWGFYRPTLIDILTFCGTLGLFFTAFLLFIRWIPMIAIAEVKGVMPEADPHHEPEGHGETHGHGEPAVAEAE
jgi:hypothetical protein